VPGKEIQIDGDKKQRRKKIQKAIDSEEKPSDQATLTPRAFPYERRETLASLPEELQKRLEAWWFGRRPVSQAMDIMREYGLKMQKRTLLRECEEQWGQFSTDEVEDQPYKVPPEEQIIALAMQKMMMVLRRFDESKDEVTNIGSIVKAISTLLGAKCSLERMKLLRESGMVMQRRAVKQAIVEVTTQVQKQLPSRPELVIELTKMIEESAYLVEATDPGEGMEQEQWIS